LFLSVYFFSPLVVHHSCMMHLLRLWLLLLLLGPTAHGSNVDKRNLVVVLEPIQYQLIPNACGSGCGVMPMRVAHVMKGHGSGWGSNCGCGDQGALVGPPPDLEDADELGFESLIESELDQTFFDDDDGDDDDDDDDDRVRRQPQSRNHISKCTPAMCYGKFRARLNKYDGISIIWSAGYGHQYNMMNMTMVRLEFKGVADKPCPGQFMDTPGIVTEDEYLPPPTSRTHTSSSVNRSFISLGQCSNCTTCGIKAFVEYNPDKEIIVGREAKITTAYIPSTFDGQRRTFSWDISGFSAFQYRGGSFKIEDFDFGGHIVQKYKVPKDQKPWAILELDDDGRKGLASAINGTEVLKLIGMFQAFIDLLYSEVFENELPELPGHDHVFAKKMKIHTWGGKCKKAVLHSRIPNATSLAQMGLTAPQVNGNASFLISVDRMDETGALVNNAEFSFTVYHPNCTNMTVFSYHGNETQPTNIANQGGSVSLISPNGTFQIAVTQTSSFVGYDTTYTAATNSIYTTIPSPSPGSTTTPGSASGSGKSVVHILSLAPLAWLVVALLGAH